MRLFVAVDVSDDTRAQLANVREQLESTLARTRKPPRITWVKPENAHVTMRFIGEVAEDTAAAIRTALNGDFTCPEFEVRWSTAGAFPGGRSPRVVWIGATAGAEELSQLAQAVNDRLTAVIGPGESRPFKAHLTVGRVKDPGAGVDWPQMLSAVRAGTTTSLVDHVTLYLSRTSPKGPTYHPLETWKLSSQ